MRRRRIGSLNEVSVRWAPHSSSNRRLLRLEKFLTHFFQFPGRSESLKVFRSRSSGGRRKKGEMCGDYWTVSPITCTSVVELVGRKGIFLFIWYNPEISDTQPTARPFLSVLSIIRVWNVIRLGGWWRTLDQISYYLSPEGPKQKSEWWWWWHPFQFPRPCIGAGQESGALYLFQFKTFISPPAIFCLLSPSYWGWWCASSRILGWRAEIGRSWVMSEESDDDWRVTCQGDELGTGCCSFRI